MTTFVFPFWWKNKQMSHLAISIGCVGSYFVLYSGYDKKTKSLKIAENLTKIFSFKQQSVSQSLDDINKVLGLAGLTLIGFGFFAPAKALVEHGAYLSFAHGAYSAYRYLYRFKMGQKKQASMVLGVVSSTTLAMHLGLLPTPSQVPLSVLPLAVASIATVHYYSMEIPPDSWYPAVRPYAYLAFVASIAATVKLALLV